MGENEICEASKALRFNEMPAYVDSERRIPLRCAFRRLFFDGLAAGKFETGIFDFHPRNGLTAHPVYNHTVQELIDRLAQELIDRAAQKLTDLPTDPELDKYMAKRLINHLMDTSSPILAQELINQILDMSVTVRNGITGAKTTTLGKAGKPLAQAYAAASTTVHQSALETWDEWWVVAGPPLLFLELSHADYLELPSPAKVVLPRDAGYGFELRYCLMPYAGRNVRAWILQFDEFHDFPNQLSVAQREAARTLRLYLLRLNAEHECLRVVLRHLESEKIDVTRGTLASNRLQQYLNNATMKINRWESKAERLTNPEIVRIARLSEDSTNPGRRDALLQRLQQFDIRPNLTRKLGEYTAQWQDVPHEGVIFNLGDRYDISGSSHQIGAVGPNAHVHHVSFSQRWNDVSNEIDLPQLAEELSVLRAKLRDDAVEPDHDAAVAEVGRAENAARAGDGPRALEHLAKAGQWALGAATDIGTMVAAAAIRASLGLP